MVVASPLRVELSSLVSETERQSPLPETYF